MDPVSGVFTGTAEGKAYDLDGQQYYLSYIGGTGNDVVLFNTAPTVDKGLAAQMIAQDSMLTYTFGADAFADAETKYGDVLAYSASGLPGWLSFDPNTRTFEGTPANSDVGSKNVTVTATDKAGATVTAVVGFTVTNVNDSPTITSSGAASVPENTTSVMTLTKSDPDIGDGGSFSIVGGADQSFFTLTGGDKLEFKAAPDFEDKKDDGANNVYDVTVRFTDTGGMFNDKAVAVTVTDEFAPQFTSANKVTINENQKSVLTVIAIDDDVADTITYGIHSGDDKAAFTIDSKSGLLTLVANADFETKNSYAVTVSASDGINLTTQAITVTVNDLPEAPL